MKRNFMLALDKISIREHRHSVVVPCLSVCTVTATWQRADGEKSGERRQHIGYVLSTNDIGVLGARRSHSNRMKTAGGQGSPTAQGSSGMPPAKDPRLVARTHSC